MGPGNVIHGPQLLALFDVTMEIIGDTEIGCNDVTGLSLPNRHDNVMFDEQAERRKLSDHVVVNLSRYCSTYRILLNQMVYLNTVCMYCTVQFVGTVVGGLNRSEQVCR